MTFARDENSTTGRSPNGAAAPLPRALRAGLGAVEALVPALAERIAERLFLTPPRHGAPGRERLALAGWEPFALRVGGTTVRGVRTGAGPAVLLVHGWGGRGAQLAAFAPRLLAAGCAVIAFDGPAHGASGGRRTNLSRQATAIDAVARRFGARAAVGHSFGGAALALALSRGLPLDAVVLVGAPRSPESFFDPFCAALGLGERTREGARRRIERQVGIPMADLDVRRLAPSLRTPALVVHDRDDREVPFEAGEAIAESWPGARLRATWGLGHRRILRDATVVWEAAEFLVARLARCGCGRLAVGAADGAPRCEACLLSVHLANPEERRAVPAA